MAATYIRPGTMTSHASRLISAVEGLNNQIAQLRLLKSSMDAMKDGADYTALETHFGLTAGQGVTVYGLVRDTLELVDALDGAQPNRLQKLLQRMG